MTSHDHLYSEPELQRLLAQPEGQFLEFKSVWDLGRGSRKLLSRREVRDTIAEYVAGFANADGGTLLIGVDDDGCPSGHGYPDEAVTSFFAVPEQRLQPGVNCRTGRMNVDGHEILIFEVPFSPQATMVAGNGFPYRTGDRTIYEPQEIINARKEAYRRVGFEQRIRPDATLEDLDLPLAADFLSTGSRGDRPITETMRSYGIIAPHGTGWGITNAALLLFGKEPLTPWHPRAGIRFFFVAGKRRRHGKDRNVTQGPRLDFPIARAIPEAHRLCRERIRSSEQLHELFFREVPEYPEFAWQEAVVNAIAHRSYEAQGQEIEIWFYEDRLEIRSPGDLVPPVTLAALRERRPVHASRNPLLVRVLADAGIMREEGEGLPRIFEEMEASFLRPPVLDLGDSVFSVTLFNEPIFVGPSPEWQALVASLNLAPAQKKALLAHPDGFTNEDYRRLNDVDRDEAYRQIQDLVGKGILRSSQKPGRGAVYRLHEDVRQARVFLEQRLPMLRAYFGEHDFIKNADYQSLFGLTRSVTTRELRRLVDEGFLRMEGERRGARYVPLLPLGGSTE